MDRHEACVSSWVKGMKTDKQRLNWLESNPNVILESYGTYWKIKMKGGRCYRENSLRDVIDVAMNQTIEKL
jgi:hypothetical protein